MTLTRLAARFGSRPAGERARAVAADRRSSEPDRLAMLDLLGELKDRASLGLLLDLSTRDDSASSSVRSAALAALGRFEDESIATALLAAYSRRDDAWKARARELLLSRASWARAYLAAVNRGALPAKEMTLDQLGRFAALRRRTLPRWSASTGGCPGARRARSGSPRSAG